MLGICFLNVFVLQNDADNFTAQLLRLYAKADVYNKSKLASVYPEAAQLYEWWISQSTAPTNHQIMKKAEEVCRK